MNKKVNVNERITKLNEILKGNTNTDVLAKTRTLGRVSGSPTGQKLHLHCSNYALS